MLYKCSKVVISYRMKYLSSLDCINVYITIIIIYLVKYFAISLKT